VFKLNDDFLSRIAEDFGNGKQVPAGQVITDVEVSVDADDYRRDLIYIRDKIEADGLTAEILWTVTVPSKLDLLLIDCAYENGSAKIMVEMFLLPRPPVTAEFRQRVGQALVDSTNKEVIVGPIITGVAAQQEQRPSSIRAAAGTLLIFRVTKFGGGAIEAGTHVIESTFLEKPATRQWFRKTDQSTIVQS